jgi:hypothetical protein
MKFRCWLTKYGDEVDGVYVDASDAEEAAKEFAESVWCDCDYPDELEVSVRAVHYLLGNDIPESGGGQKEIFVVTAEPMLIFYAKKKGEGT